MGYSTEEANRFNREHALKAMHKFNYFFVGLTFSILSLAVNHGLNVPSIFSKIVGLSGWATFSSFRNRRDFVDFSGSTLFYW